MHWIYLIHEFHYLSWITEINEHFHDILIYWDAPVCDTGWIVKFGNLVSLSTLSPSRQQYTTQNNTFLWFVQFYFCYFKEIFWVYCKLSSIAKCWFLLLNYKLHISAFKCSKIWPHSHFLSACFVLFCFVLFFVLWWSTLCHKYLLDCSLGRIFIYLALFHLWFTQSSCVAIWLKCLASSK